MRRGDPAFDLSGEWRDRRQSRGYYSGNALVTVREKFIPPLVVESITNRTVPPLWLLFPQTASHQLTPSSTPDSRLECPAPTQVE
ncbi:hypothetical protein HMPREF1979_01233 [Actinomyces johnsonii F0542]|uniref:Uncharacterized protein n=1 Tax=Actinomyces johnsonii F0542 TaxID=1321818 RepID=U1RXX1_9ACTO|nr:hypothetical protein HMPREF1979_01233 [Actinomyces johnsonii F0542]